MKRPCLTIADNYSRALFDISAFPIIVLQIRQQLGLSTMDPKPTPAFTITHRNRATGAPVEIVGNARSWGTQAQMTLFRDDSGETYVVNSVDFAIAFQYIPGGQ